MERVGGGREERSEEEGVMEEILVFSMVLTVPSGFTG